MMAYQNTNKDLIGKGEILIIGLGGAGTNIINSVNKYGLRGGEALAISADTRSLKSCKVKNKIQIGATLRRGLACGGDPSLGLKAAQETEDEIRAQIAGKKIVFLCVGLGGGTGSGAAPLVTRIAREENAFIVVFATMPFVFEGSRRRQQAEAGLNELAAIASALVTFDNGRMAELVSPDQSIHDAFEASNHLISSSILSISRIALFPGIVHIGLDDLVSTLSANRSRCLFGAGSAKGKGRVDRALKMALASPLIDKGKLLNTSEKVIVHICGGTSTTLQETEQFMSGVVENLGVATEIFFGVSIDESMGEEFTATIISSLPEEQVLVPDKRDESNSNYSALVGHTDEPEVESLIEKEVSEKEVPVLEKEAVKEEEPAVKEEAADLEDENLKTPEGSDEDKPIKEEPVKDEEPLKEEESTKEDVQESAKIEPVEESEIEKVAINKKTGEVFVAKKEESLPEQDVKLEEIDPIKPEEKEEVEAEKDEEPEEDKSEGSPIRRRFAHLFSAKDDKKEEEPKEEPVIEPIKSEEKKDIEITQSEDKSKTTENEDLFSDAGQAELFGESKPKGRFEGESPNIEDGADLDIPTFLRTSD